MTDSEYWSKTYFVTVRDGGADLLRLRKSGGSDWSEILMDTNGKENGCITIRSREMAEQLWFMLGQMLGRR